jgi:NAD-dependent deacetylase
MGEFIARVRAGDPDPHCEECGGIVKSDAVLFEQALPQDVLQRSYREAVECDVLLAIGTTLGVIPAAYVVDRAKDAGKKVVIINGGPTERDRYADLILQGDITRILTDLVVRAGFPT